MIQIFVTAGNQTAKTLYLKCTFLLLTEKILHLDKAQKIWENFAYLKT